MHSIIYNINMIDIKLLRTNFDEVEKNIQRRNKYYPALKEFKTIDAQ
jgi:seryl-tRNA synthetase